MEVRRSDPQRYVPRVVTKRRQAGGRPTAGVSGLQCSARMTMLILGGLFHVINQEELAGTSRRFEFQPESRKHRKDRRWCILA